MSTPHRVARVELYHVAIPLPATFRPAWIPGMPSNENRFTVVKITTEDGVEGYSAGPAIGRQRVYLCQVMTGTAFADQRFDPLRHQREIGFERLFGQPSGIAGHCPLRQRFCDYWLCDWHLHGGLPVP